LRIATKNGEKTISTNKMQMKELSSTIPLTIFDITWPYFAWVPAAYEGPRKIVCRRSQCFLVNATSDEWAPIVSVRVWLDAKYCYPIGWDALDSCGNVIRRLRLRSVAENMSGEYGPKRIDISIPNEHKTIHVDFIGKCSSK
jgi:hypothetical protein